MNDISQEFIDKKVTELYREALSYQKQGKIDDAMLCLEIAERFADPRSCKLTGGRLVLAAAIALKGEKI